MLKTLVKASNFDSEWRGHLHIALQHRFKHLIVVVKGRVREDLDADLAVHLGVDTLGEQLRGDALGVLVGIGDMRELDDDLALIAADANGGTALWPRRARARSVRRSDIFIGGPPHDADFVWQTARAP